MSRFLFHLNTDSDFIDHEGVELSDLFGAKDYAVQLLTESLVHQPEKFWHADGFRVTCADEKGLVLFTVDMLATMSAAGANSR